MVSKHRIRGDKKPRESRGGSTCVGYEVHVMKSKTTGL